MSESKSTETPSDPCDVICPHCGNRYQAEAEDYSEREREETCFKCERPYLVYQEFEVTHHTRPLPNKK